MGPYPCGSGAAANGWPSPEPDSASSPPELDNLLAGAGYRVRSSDLRHVAQSLERLDSAMIDFNTIGGDHHNPQHHLPSSDAVVHYNPSDLTAWVDSMLSELSPSLPDRHVTPLHSTWTDQIFPPPIPNPNIPTPLNAAAARQREEEEDSGIRLVHLLMNTADAVQRGDSPLAASLIEEMRLLLTRVNTGFGIGKVAGYFIDALCRRLFSSPQASAVGSPADAEILYHHFYEACPYLKFAHFTANQAILEAFDGHDRVHVIDFNLMHGLQWPALIQALALRPGGPPFLRLTGIGPPSPDGRDALREVGLRLAELARSVHVRFAFRGVAANRLDDVRPWMLQVAAGEAVAVNSVFQLHKLLGDPETGSLPIDSVLGWIAGLKPKIVTVVEQEADHNKPAFLDRFTEALFYYSTVFDSLEGGRGAGTAAAVAEVYLQREICNIVCCEGANRVERHEPLGKWRVRLGRAGLRAVHLGSNAFKQASMLLTLFSGEGYGVEEVEGCLTLGWHSRPLISASAWRADDDDVEQPDSNITINSSSSTLLNNVHNNKNNSNGSRKSYNNNGNNLRTSSSSSSTSNNGIVNSNREDHQQHTVIGM